MPKPLGKRRSADQRAQILSGLQLETEGRLDEAERIYTDVLQSDPKNFYALYRLGIFHADRGDDVQALRLLQTALKSGATGEILRDCAIVLERLGRLTDAIEIYNRALIINPNDIVALLNRGKAYTGLGQHANAAASYEKLLSKSPGHAQALNSFGHAQIELGRYQAAITSFTRAIAADPEFASAHFNRALALLTLGHLEEGWQEYQWRFGVEGLKESRLTYTQPEWDGVEPLAGKTILLYAEQGMGDSIMFLRYAPIIAAQGADVIAGVLGPVKVLASEMSGVTGLTPGDPLPAFDLQCPLLSLPYYLKTRIETIPADVPYLSPPADRLEIWKNRVPRDKPLTVGVVWAGGLDFKGDRSRTVGLRRFATLFDIPDIRFVCLQRDLREGDAELLREWPHVMTFGEQLNDFGDTAALIASLDLVISVDTAVAHLAGAMAKPVWILLPRVPDFRWMLDRTDSPWYPTARLFRQPAVDDWAAVMANVTSALSTFRSR